MQSCYGSSSSSSSPPPLLLLFLLLLHPSSFFFSSSSSYTSSFSFSFSSFFFFVPQLHLWGSPFWAETFAYVTVFFVFFSKHRCSHIPSSWMVRDGCVFVAGIHPSRTRMPGSFESVRWNACVHRLGLYSHPKEFWGNGVRAHVNSKEKKSPLPQKKKKKILRGGLNPRRCMKQDSAANCLQHTRSSGQAQACTHHVQHIGCSSRTTCRVPRGTKGQLSY